MHHDNHHTEPLGPTRDEIELALERLIGAAPTVVPDVEAARVLEAAEMIPVTVEDRRIVELSITRGQPEHGEMRSDDHISDYAVEYDRDCDDCDRPTRHRHEYHAYHHIAGQVHTYCKRCGNTVNYEEWS